MICVKQLIHCFLHITSLIDSKVSSACLGIIFVPSFVLLDIYSTKKIKDFKKFKRLLLKKLNRKLIKNTKYYQKNHFSFYTDGLLWNKSFIFPYLEWINLYSFNVDFNYCKYFLFVSVDRLFF